MTKQKKILTRNYNKNSGPKSNWKPNPPNRILDLFQRTVKQEILKCRIKKRHYNNLTKEERAGLKQLQDNPHITIKKLIKVLLY